jgi:CRISPR/Cas system-associated exonuclease Cas4 (RecB family)
MTENIWQLSQTHLNLLSTCPRKFQYIYLEQFTSPCTAQQESKLMLGNRFHRFMQQRELGLPTEPILAADEPLQTSFEALAQAAPNIVYPQPDTWRKAEHRCTLLKEQFLLTGIYDLLILSPTEAHIIDWKTYPQPFNTKKLANHWQTRLYLYLLAETSHYSPEQIKFTYWFIHVPQKPTSLTFQYNQSQHEKTEEDLTQLLNQLSGHWQDYQEGKAFPQVEESKGYCVGCPFTIPCERYPQKENLSLSEVEEVEI